MIVALIDNGSLEPAAHRHLREVAGAIGQRTGIAVRAVSWKHSDAIPADAIDGTPAWTLQAFIRALVALGQREFIFIPFFVSAQGAIGSALRADLEKLQRELVEFEFRFTDGLAARGVIPSILAERIRDVVVDIKDKSPAVVVVDHGGPSRESALLRDQVTAAARQELGNEIDFVAAASMEGAHPPLLENALREPALRQRAVIVAPLFLSPGRHAGPNGDITRIVRMAHPRVHVAALLGSHPKVIDALAAALQDSLTPLHA